jgi:hypothetical protein
MLNFKEITKEGGNTKIGGNPRAYFKLAHLEKISNN